MLVHILHFIPIYANGDFVLAKEEQQIGSLFLIKTCRGEYLGLKER
jgi:hypothetical protein